MFCVDTIAQLCDLVHFTCTVELRVTLLVTISTSVSKEQGKLEEGKCECHLVCVTSSLLIPASLNAAVPLDLRIRRNEVSPALRCWRCPERPLHTGCCLELAQNLSHLLHPEPPIIGLSYEFLSQNPAENMFSQYSIIFPC